MFVLSSLLVLLHLLSNLFHQHSMSKVYFSILPFRFPHPECSIHVWFFWPRIDSIFRTLSSLLSSLFFVMKPSHTMVFLLQVLGHRLLYRLWIRTVFCMYEIAIRQFCYPSFSINFIFVCSSLQNFGELWLLAPQISICWLLMACAFASTKSFLEFMDSSSLLISSPNPVYLLHYYLVTLYFPTQAVSKCETFSRSVLKNESNGIYTIVGRITHRPSHPSLDFRKLLSVCCCHVLG